MTIINFVVIQSARDDQRRDENELYVVLRDGLNYGERLPETGTPGGVKALQQDQRRQDVGDVGRELLHFVNEEFMQALVE